MHNAKLKKIPFLDRFYTHVSKESGSYRRWFHFPMYKPRFVNEYALNLELQIILAFIVYAIFNYLGESAALAIALFMLVVYNILIYKPNTCLDDNDIEIECHWGKKVDHLSLGIRLDNASEHPITLNISIPKLFSLYLSINLGYSYLIKLTNLKKSTKHQRKNGKGYFYEPYHGHSTGFSFSPVWSHIDFLYCDMDTEFNRWFSFSKGWDTNDLLYGKLDIESIDDYIPVKVGLTKSKYEVTINVPEMNDYPPQRLKVAVSYRKTTHNRPRWKKAFTWVSTNIDGIESTGPVLRNGKGENSWDCDDVDLSIPCMSTGELLLPGDVEEYYINHIKEERRRYG